MLRSFSFPVCASCPNLPYIKGRFIGESIRVINDLIEHIEREGDEGILFSTDIEKAFDLVDHIFLFSTLEKFRFGFDFIKWIKTLLILKAVVWVLNKIF